MSKILEVNTGTISLQLAVVDFKFHSSFLANEDNQWLKIEANLVIDGFSKKVQSRCLMHNELAELKNWYLSMRDNILAKPPQFIENPLWFECDNEKNICIGFDNQFDWLKEYLNINGFENIAVPYNSFKIDTQIKLLEAFINYR